MFGIQMGRMGGVGQMPLAQRIAYMFSNSEPGAWYDPSDMSTLFQDSAGTVPVTAVEQPVGRILDKSGRGNHATQATTTKRPIYSRRVNILLNTANQSAWSYQGSRFTAGSVDGNGAALLTASVQNEVLAGVHTDYPLGVTTYAPPSCFVRSIEVKAGTATHVAFGSAGNSVQLRLSDGFVTNYPLLSAYSVTATSDGYWRLELYHERPAGGFIATELSNYLAWGVGDPYTNQIGATLYARRPSFSQHAVGFRSPVPYQRVTTATDYDADPAKFPGYLLFDGVDDALATGNIDFTGTDKMTVWAGVTKLSDAATSILLESSVNTNSNSGSFYITAPETPGASSLSFKSRGSLNPTPVHLFGNAAPLSRVVSTIGDIGGDITTIRVAGASSTSAQDQGTGSYGNYPLYIGAREGTSLFFNGRLYNLIVRGAQSSLSQIEATELYMKQKMRLP